MKAVQRDGFATVLRSRALNRSFKLMHSLTNSARVAMYALWRIEQAAGGEDLSLKLSYRVLMDFLETFQGEDQLPVEPLAVL